MPQKKVLLGFSGGIDSSAAAEILSGKGYAVTGVYLDMCGSGEQVQKAVAKAASIGIECRVVNIRERFEKNIIDYFTDEYFRGRTPAPCTVCNRDIKWKTLYDLATAEGFDHIASGHYFNVEKADGKYYVCTASDRLKDQSYYLWPLSQDILGMALTPMGDRIKEDIKKSLAGRASLKESMGVCFLEGKSCRQFLSDNYGSQIKEGDIVTGDGKVIGRHKGTPYYTIGQKRDLGLKPGYCATKIDAEKNVIVAGPDNDLYYHNLVISGCNIVNIEEVLTLKGITVKIRGIGRNPENPCTIKKINSGFQIKLDDPAWAPAEGQPVVLYRGRRVVGGGFLEEYF